MTAPNEPEEKKGPVLERVQTQLAAMLAPPLDAALYLVATPIGNLGDVSLRALSVLARADVIYCEDTRHSRTLLTHYGLRPRFLRSYHEHNGEHERPLVLAHIQAGRSVALISDAGSPLVCDPGFKLVRAAIADGIQVVSLPGACAAIAAIQLSGLPSDSFHFAGFLPTKEGARRERLHALKGLQATLIFFETAPRLAASLDAMEAALGARHAVVARELTKLHEAVVRGRLNDIARSLADQALRGELVVLVGPPEPEPVTDQAIMTALQEAAADLSLKDRSRAVAEALGIGKRRVYDLAIKRQSMASDPR